jgi:DNA-binding GntR family transcriptional regulator
MDRNDLQQGSTVQREILSSVDRRTIDERVYDQLRDAIMGGAFRPGDVVTLRGLAKTFGISLTPVRSAVNRLTMENGLVTLPNRSISLPRLTIPEFEEMTDIRVALESLATRHAATRISSAQIDRVAALNRAMDKAEPAEYFRLNREFHFSIYAAADRAVLFRLIQGAWLRVGPLLNSPESYATELSHAKHDWIVSALRRRDPEDAATLIAADVRSAAHVLRNLMEQGSTQKETLESKGSESRARPRDALRMPARPVSRKR